MKRILIADDHQMFLDGLIEILKRSKRYKVIGTAKNGNEALEILRNEEVDIAVLDIEMPELNGIDLARIMKKEFPNIKILVLSMYKTPSFIRNVLNIGCSGYVLKERGKEELIEALDEIVIGKTYYGKETTRILFDNLQVYETERRKKEEFSIKLTKREKEVLQLISDGNTARQIGELLFIAPTTVETHRRNLKDKTGCKSTKALVRWAIENDQFL